MEDRQTLRRATELWRQGYRHQTGGNVDRAIELYRQSIELYPTAEAHTFLGWAMSFQGHLERPRRSAFARSRSMPSSAIPYNDIGVYLMQQDKLDESISWLEKAKQAKRYEPRQFPFLNLGRIYIRQGRWWEALREVRRGGAAGSA